MVLAGRRPRTVLGRLVGRACPPGRCGLPPRVVAAAGPGGACRSCRCAWPRVLGGQLSGGWSSGRRRSRLPVAAPGGRAHACRSPRRPRDGRLAGTGKAWSCRGPSQCSRPHREVYAGSTAITARPALAAIWVSRSRNRAGRDARDQPPEAPPAPAAGRPAAVALASLLAGVGEVQVLDHDRPAAVLRGRARSAPEMAARSRPSRCEAGSPARTSGIVTGGPAGFPSGVTAHASRWPWFRSTARTGAWRRSSRAGAGAGRGAPGRVEVPAVPCRVVADVVADRAGGRLGGDLIAPVGELHRARQPVPAVRPVRQVRQRGGQLHLQPALVRVPPDRLVPPRLVLLPVGGQEQPGRFPLAPPLRLGQPRGGKVAALAQQGPPAPHHGHGPASSRRSTAARRALSTCRRTALPCRSAGVAYPRARPSLPPAGTASRASIARIRARRPDLLRAQVPRGELPLVLAGAGDRTGPPGRRLRRQRPLPPGAGRRAALRVQPPLRAPGGQVTARQRPQVRAGRPQHRLILPGHAQPGPHPRPRRRGHHERLGDRTQRHHPPPPHGDAHRRRAAARGPMSRCACARSVRFTLQAYNIEPVFAI